MCSDPMTERDAAAGTATPQRSTTNTTKRQKKTKVIVSRWSGNCDRAPYSHEDMDQTLEDIARRENARAAQARAQYEAGCLSEVDRVLDLADEHGPEFFAGYENHRHASAATAAVAHAEGRAELARELAEAQRDYLGREARALSACLTSTPPYAELCERRGEHERAERQRRILRERGIA